MDLGCWGGAAGAQVALVGWDLSPCRGGAEVGRELKPPPPFLACQNEREETLTTNVWIEMVRPQTGPPRLPLHLVVGWHRNPHPLLWVLPSVPVLGTTRDRQPRGVL